MNKKACKHCGGEVKQSRRQYYCSFECQHEAHRDRNSGKERLDVLQALADVDDEARDAGLPDEAWLRIDSHTLQTMSDSKRKLPFAERRIEIHGRNERVYYRITEAGRVLLHQLKSKLAKEQ